MDVDLVADMTDAHVSEFLKCFGQDFYLSEPAIRDAIRRKSCFNLIHLPTSFKVDVFVSRQRPFDITAMNRAKLEQLGDSQVLEIQIATPEDAIISKLEWYRKTNETSERQWDDVTRLLKLLGDAAEVEYAIHEPTEMGEDNKDLFRRILRDFTTAFQFALPNILDNPAAAVGSISNPAPAAMVQP